MSEHNIDVCFVFYITCLNSELGVADAYKCCCCCSHRETNLKVKQALPETAEMGDDLEQLSQFSGESLGLLLYKWELV